jgi:hypothetical protein
MLILAVLLKVATLPDCDPPKVAMLPDHGCPNVTMLPDCDPPKVAMLPDHGCQNVTMLPDCDPPKVAILLCCIFKNISDCSLHTSVIHIGSVSDNNTRTMSSSELEDNKSSSSSDGEECVSERLAPYGCDDPEYNPYRLDNTFIYNR